MSIYVSPVFEINDINGAPQVGAKLVFYTPGTTNLKTIYSDADFSTSRTNPVTAVSSSAGAIYPIIYLDGLYDVVQQDSAGTVDTDDGATIWTRDDIGAVSSGQFTLWLNDTTYSIPEIVLGSNDEYYRSLVDANQGNDPTTSAAQWEQLRLGRIWNTNVTYSIGESAYGSNGYLYISRTNSNSGNDPISDGTNWANGSGKVLLDVKTASSSASLDFTTSINSRYSHYLFECINLVPATDSVTLQLRVSDDAGSTWKQGAADYIDNVPATTAQADLTGSTISNVAAEGGFSGKVDIWSPANASVYTTGRGIGVAFTATPGTNANSSPFSYTTAEIIDGIQFFMSSGNIASGEIRLYGMS